MRALLGLCQSTLGVLLILTVACPNLAQAQSQEGAEYEYSFASYETDTASTEYNSAWAELQASHWAVQQLLTIFNLNPPRPLTPQEQDIIDYYVFLWAGAMQEGSSWLHDRAPVGLSCAIEYLEDAQERLGEALAAYQASNWGLAITKSQAAAASAGTAFVMSQYVRENHVAALDSMKSDLENLLYTWFGP